MKLFWHAQKCSVFLAHRKTSFSKCPKNPLWIFMILNS